jgi:hypothetical protein
MKQTYYSSLFSMYARIAEAVCRSGMEKFNSSNPVFGRVGIKFDVITSGKLYPCIFVKKEYLWLVAKEPDEPSVMCQLTFL